MVRKYIFGNPISTIAVIDESCVTDTICDAALKPIPYFRKKQTKGIKITCDLDPSDVVYGLGETMRGVNKRGGRYIMYNTDEPNHSDKTKSLYGAHNFLIIDGGLRTGAAGEPEPIYLGLFFDTPSRIIFDVDVNASGKLSVETENSDFILYTIYGSSVGEVADIFLGMIGRSFLPPLWSFGFGQSRWGYKTRKDFDEVLCGYRKAGIPLDYLCMDIDYMDRYIDFTIHPKRFPELKTYISELKDQGIHLVPIIDAGIKIEPGNPVYEEGIEKGYFCTNESGKPFSAAVWPGLTHFPDFFQKEAGKWFGLQYKALTDLGLEGFWNDMNEPAIFYSEYSKRQSAIDTILNAALPSRAERTGSAESNAYQDYHRFFHKIGGKVVKHHDVHNLYGALMTKASGEGLNELLDHRYLLFSRSSYIGAHRYGGIWTGDNASRWDHLKAIVCQMPGLNMCGFIYSGSDTGGFGGSCSRELMLRWLAFSLFTPLMRNHAAMFSTRQECYRYKHTEDFASVISLRYRLLPYIYSEFMKAALQQKMYMKPLSFAYPGDLRARQIEDQLIVGESMMIAPVITRGAEGRNVYLPEDMIEVRYSQTEDFRLQPAAAGDNFLKVGLGEVVFYILPHKAVAVTADPVEGPISTRDIDLEKVILLGDGESYEQYLDDGLTKECSMDKVRVVRKSG